VRIGELLGHSASPSLAATRTVRSRTTGQIAECDRALKS
jgi:hypothetical protein